MYDFEVSLVGARPRVWRRFLLATSATFFDLHEAIQRACGWQDRHLFSFNVPSKVPGPPTIIAGIPDVADFLDETPDARSTRLARYFTAGTTMVTYEYDFGDEWNHTVKLQGLVEQVERRKRILLDGARAFPPEDCGGMEGYRQCVAFVRSGRIPGKNDSDDNRLGQWLPKTWHPDHFDIDKTRKHFDSRVGKKPDHKAFAVSEPPSGLPVAEPASRSTNPWCAALGIPVPAIATVAVTKRPYGQVKLSDLAMVALLARGAPMTDADVLADEGYSHRGLSIIDKDGVVRDQMVTDEPLGRSVEEAVRMLDALQYFEKSEEVCQANFKGEESLGSAGVPLTERFVT